MKLQESNVFTGVVGGGGRVSLVSCPFRGWVSLVRRSLPGVGMSRGWVCACPGGMSRGWVHDITDTMKYSIINLNK